MAKPDAATLRADPKAAAEYPADDAGADEHLHATPQHPGFLRLRSGPTAAADPPANVSGIDEHLHADVQHPPLLPAGRDAPCSAGRARNPTGKKWGRRS